MRDVLYGIDSSTRMNPGGSARSWFPLIGGHLSIRDLEVDSVTLLRQDLQNEVIMWPSSR